MKCGSDKANSSDSEPEFDAVHTRGRPEDIPLSDPVYLRLLSATVKYKQERSGKHTSSSRSSASRNGTRDISMELRRNSVNNLYVVTSKT